MKTQVRYFSQTGNTKRLADAIAAAADTQALTIDTPIAEKTDLLFLGAAVYWAGIDRRVKDFIASLDPKKVGRVAIFSNSALAERAYPIPLSRKHSPGKASASKRTISTAAASSSCCTEDTPIQQTSRTPTRSPNESY